MASSSENAVSRSARLRQLISEACAALYENDKLLISTRAHERTIAAHLAGYLKPMFGGWDVDTDYNREGREGDSKRDDVGLIVPDIIIHARGFKTGPNLVAIQVKGYWNKESRDKDEEDLRRLKAKYRYKFLYRLELGEEGFEVIPVS